jgi:hypothetical protein
MELQDTINQRILKVMEHGKFNFSTMGLALNYSDVVIGNIIKGRNKPSFEFIEKLIQTFDWINHTWLLTGQGHMLKPESTKKEYHFVGTDKMVSEIAHMQAELSDKNSQIADLRDHISTLKTQLSECQNDKKLLLNSVFSDKKTVK